MARLTSLGVRGFKSIKDLQPLELRPVNVLVGANGAGKSNLISFFRLLNAIPAGKLQEFVGRAGGASTLLWYGSRETLALWADVGFEGKAGGSYYRFGLTSTDTDTLIFEDEHVASPIVAHSRLKLYNLGSGQRESLVTSEENGFGELRSLLAGIQVFHFEDTSESAAIRRRGYIEDNRQLHHDAGNLAAFLYGLLVSQPSYYRRIVSAIQQIAPFFEDFDLSPLKTDANSILLNWRDRGSTQLFGPHQLSDGTLRTMALVALLAQPESDLPSVIVIDEPEIGLHPYALEIVAALVKSASVHCTIVLATQSVGLVNHFAPEDIVTVTRDTAQTKFERQNSETLSVWLEDYGIGEIWERNLIGGNPSR